MSFLRNIFGPNGQVIAKVGDTTYRNNTAYTKSGNITYGSDGSVASKIGCSIFQGDLMDSTEPRVITKVGPNSWMTNDLTRYDLVGQTLICSDGRMWHNIQSEEEAEEMIIMDR